MARAAAARQEASSVGFLHLQEADFFFFFTVPRFTQEGFVLGSRVNSQAPSEKLCLGNNMESGRCSVGASLSHLWNVLRRGSPLNILV